MYLSKRERAVLMATIRNLLDGPEREECEKVLSWLTDSELEETINILLAYK